MPQSRISKKRRTASCKGAQACNEQISYFASFAPLRETITAFRLRGYSGLKRFFVDDVRHIGGVAAVVAFEHVHQSLDSAPGHAFGGVG